MEPLKLSVKLLPINVNPPEEARFKNCSQEKWLVKEKYFLHENNNYYRKRLFCNKNVVQKASSCDKNPLIGNNFGSKVQIRYKLPKGDGLSSID